MQHAGRQYAVMHAFFSTIPSILHLPHRSSNIGPVRTETQKNTRQEEGWSKSKFSFPKRATTHYDEGVVLFKCKILQVVVSVIMSIYIWRERHLPPHASERGASKQSRGRRKESPYVQINFSSGVSCIAWREKDQVRVSIHIAKNATRFCFDGY